MNKTIKYSLGSEGEFVIENYNHAKLFTNFFPGIAGVWGIPMWVFYVNRGQGITSFGIEGKNKAIMEFQPANKAYRMTSLHGFRTFIKVKQGAKTIFYEPFQNNLPNKAFKLQQKMIITSHDLTLEETNLTLGISVRVNYFTLPEESYAALVRCVTVKNISRSKSLNCELIDGMPAIIPFGHNDWLLKNMSRTAEAWNQVSNLENKAPYYNLKVAISDTPRVEHVTEGNFYFSFSREGKKLKLLDPIVRPTCIFGSSSDLVLPEGFLEQRNFKVPLKQTSSKKTPCAMSLAAFSLKAGAQKEITSLIGNIRSLKHLNSIVHHSLAEGYIQGKAQRNKEIIDEIKNFVFTASSSREFDLYCGQTFLDNVLRGGLPISMETRDGKIVFNVFSRKHGDPERDYNYFVLAPTYLSQGNGNYRDVNQNRRNDIWFNQDVKDSSIVDFFSLIQADGYNPLVTKGTMFCLDEPQKLSELLKGYVKSAHLEQLRELLTGNFSPGELLSDIEQKGIQLTASPKDFLCHVLAFCRKHQLAEHDHGFWVDHWTYNLDLLESFFSIYPEEKRRVLLENNAFSFYHNAHYVLPRDQRYVLTSYGPRQYHSIAKGKISAGKDGENNKLKTEGGSGSVYYTNLFGKILCIIANKAASFDPGGIGIEMEAGKPGWYDALNGLPGLTGSSTAETFELKRLCVFLLQALEELGLSDNFEFKIFEELFDFILDLSEIVAAEYDAVSFWKKSNDLKENYRSRIREGISGREKTIALSNVRNFLKEVINRTDKAIAHAKDKNGLYVTYFVHEVTQYEMLEGVNPQGLPYIRPLNFRRRALPLFLEGFVHALKVAKSHNEAAKIYEGVKKSAIFDKKLKMYKVNASLSKETEEIGRARIFPPGWLENESIWSHMEYKFLLELLRCGLHKEFYENFKTTLVPFLNADSYGRSILENSSFLVSSAYEDSHLHGRGFVARLSGTTAELVHLWLMMNTGERPFYLDKEGKLVLSLKPVLPGWLFTKKETAAAYFDKNNRWQQIVLPKNTYAFNFLGSTLVVYHNPKRLDTFGARKAVIERIVIHYPHQKEITISAAVILSEHAENIRSNKASRMDVFLA
ncbi:MAG TPA: hypothetical protein PK790_05735 [Candidatus Omnitrophota bacterium]|nr:hypothetical protein [Candidatus Omnitrophota bacterium]